MPADPLSPSHPVRTRPADPVVSIVLPVFNECAVLPELREAVVGTLDDAGVRFEIVFVDDGSADGSGAVLDEFARDDERISVVHLSRNFGHQAAVQAGLEYASGDAVVVMDSDLQDDPAAIPVFLAEWRAGFDVVYAIRTDRKEGPVKRWLFHTFYRLLAAVSEVDIPRDAGNFGLVDRRVVRAILRMGDTDRFYPGLRRWVGFRQKGVRVERRARYDGRPRVSLWGLVRLAKSAVFSFSRIPLTAFHALAALAAVVGTGVLGYAAIAWAAGATVPSWTALAVVAAWLTFVPSLGVAIIGEYLTRTLEGVRARPPFIVDRVTSRATLEHPSTEPVEPLLATIDALYNAPRTPEPRSRRDSNVPSHD